MGNTQKNGKRRLTALLLLVAAFGLGTACKDVFSPPNVDSAMGILALHFADSAAHNRATIVPCLEQNQFNWYVFALTRTDVAGSTSYHKYSREEINSIALPLAAGTYRLKVMAFVAESRDAADPSANSYSAYQSLDNITIENGRTADYPIVLQFVDAGYDQTGKGTFSWDFAGIGDFEKVTMDIIPLADDDIISLILADKSNPAHDTIHDYRVELDSGYYRVVLTLEGEGRLHRSIVWRQSLHVYRNMDSRFSYEFTLDDLNRTLYTITYHYYPGTSAYMEKSYFYGETAQIDGGPAREGYHFYRWEDETGTPYTGGSDFLVEKAITLYAQWFKGITGTDPANPDKISTSMKLVEVPAGSFTMSNLEKENELVVERSQEVTLSRDFYMGMYEVTQGQYAEVMKLPGPADEDMDRPVVGISWRQALEFCNELSKLHGLGPVYRFSVDYMGEEILNVNWDARGYRLPTAAEWEYAAKGGGDSALLYAGSNDPNAVAWYNANSTGRTRDVGNKAPMSLASTT